MSIEITMILSLLFYLVAGTIIIKIFSDKTKQKQSQIPVTKPTAYLRYVKFVNVN